jgi:glutamine amidotransferase
VTTAIIDSGGANISSVVHALRRLGEEPVFTADAATIRSAERVILPGVGAAGAAMSHLRERDLIGTIQALTQPVLGICLGMQLLFEHASEDDVECLCIIPGRIEKMCVAPGVRIPHMGWNTTEKCADDPLLEQLPERPWFYFVHSYHAVVDQNTLASCHHGLQFAAIVRKDNFYGVQFHPERSAGHGARLLANFLASDQSGSFKINTC